MVAILGVLILAAYFNAFGTQLVSDDIAIIRENPILQTGHGLFTISSTLRDVFFFLIYQVAHDSVLPYHLLNILFHFGCVALLYLIVRRLSNTWVAFWAAALAAVHPVAVEAVTWISGGSYPQYSFFVLAAFFLYLQEDRRKKYYLLSLLLFVLALYTASKAVVFPFLILAYEFGLGSLKKNKQYILGYFAVLAVGILLIIPGVAPRVSEVSQGTVENRAFENPLLQLPFALTTYFFVLLWPAKLTFYYSELLMPFWNWLLRSSILLGFLALLAYMYRRSRFVFFWLLFFLIALSPLILPIRVAWLVAERYVYLGSMGLFTAFSYGVWQLGKRYKAPQIATGVMIVITALLLMRTVIRNQDWQTPETLWLATIKTSPSSPLAHYNLAGVYIEKKQPANAAAELQKAVAINPIYFEAYHNLGNVYFSMGKGKLALAAYQKALEINPQLWQSYQNIAAVYMSAGNLPAAEDSIQKALAIQPKAAVLYIYQGFIFLKEGKKTAAKSAYEQALQLDPGNHYAMTGLQNVEK